MKQKEISTLSLELINKFFDGSMTPLIDHLSEDVLWVGPLDSQSLQGKAVLSDVLRRARVQNRYTLGDISLQTSPAGKKGLNLILFYNITVRHPDGTITRLRQRTLLAWEEQKLSGPGRMSAAPRITLILVSNAAAPGQAASDPRGKTSSALSDAGLKSGRVLIRGLKDESHYLDASGILFIESADNSHHSLVHTSSGLVVPCLDKVAVLAEQYGGYFLRCHASYLVNPRYVTGLRRFSLTMSDGTVLPVPEKKYTAFKKALNDRVLDQKGSES